MRFIAVLLLPSLGFAAPAPKQPEKPAIELKLAAANPLGLEITIQNNGKETVGVDLQRHAVRTYRRRSPGRKGETVHDPTHRRKSRKGKSKNPDGSGGPIQDPVHAHLPLPPPTRGTRPENHVSPRG